MCCFKAASMLYIYTNTHSYCVLATILLFWLFASRKFLCYGVNFCWWFGFVNTKQESYIHTTTFTYYSFFLFLLCVQRDIKDDHIILKINNKKEKENLVRPLEFYFYYINLYCYRVKRCWEINLLDFNSLYVAKLKCHKQCFIIIVLYLFLCW